MAAQIIPFPKLQTVNEGMAAVDTAALQQAETFQQESVTRLHLVRPSAFARTQQTARRIVEDICLEHHLAHPAFEPAGEHSVTFWATLTMPPARVETPLSVAKRLAHLILPMGQHA